jgi:hypothetical protein
MPFSGYCSTTLFSSLWRWAVTLLPHLTFPSLQTSVFSLSYLQTYHLWFLLLGSCKQCIVFPPNLLLACHLGCLWLPPAATCCHLLSHLLPPAVACCRLQPSSATCCHMLLPAATCYHLLSPEASCCHPATTCWKLLLSAATDVT